MSLIRDTSWSALSAVLQSGGRFLISIILARKLGVDDFGRFAFIQWLMDMTVMFCAFGLPGSASRFFAELNGKPGIQNAFQRWWFLRSFLLVGLVFMGFPLLILIIGYGLPTSSLITLACWGAAALMLALLTARAQGLMRFKRLALSNILYTTIALAGCMFLPEHGNDINHIILIIMSATALAAAVLWSPLLGAGTDDRGDLSGELRASLKKFCLNVWITSLVGALVWSRGEMALVQSMLGVKDVAMYAVAVTLVGLAVHGTMFLTGAIGPHLTQLWGSGKLQEAQTLCRFFTNILTFSAAISSVFLILFGTDLVFFAYGAKFQSADRILPVLALGILGLSSSAANNLLLIKTDGAYGRNLNLLGALCLFGLAFPLIMLFGTEGAAASRAIVQVGMGLVAFYFVFRLVSSDAVSWMVQGRAVVLVTLLLVLQSLGPFPLNLRIIQFALFSLTAMILLTEKQDRLKIRYLMRVLLSKERINEIRE